MFFHEFTFSDYINDYQLKDFIKVFINNNGFGPADDNSQKRGK